MYKKMVLMVRARKPCRAGRHASHFGRDGLLRRKGGRGAFFNGGRGQWQRKGRVSALVVVEAKGSNGMGAQETRKSNGAVGSDRRGGGFLSCIAGCQRGCELAAAVWLQPRAYGAWETRENGAAGVDGKGRGTRSNTGEEEEWFGVVVGV